MKRFDKKFLAEVEPDYLAAWEANHDVATQRTLGFNYPETVRVEARYAELTKQTFIDFNAMLDLWFENQKSDCTVIGFAVGYCKSGFIFEVTMALI